MTRAKGEGSDPRNTEAPPSQYLTGTHADVERLAKVSRKKK